MTFIIEYIKDRRRMLMTTWLFVFLCLLLTSTELQTNAHAAECKRPISEGHGNATSQKKAKRNARISLEANLRRAHPGDSKRYLSKGIEYKCKKSVLWQCRAKVKACK